MGWFRATARQSRCIHDIIDVIDGSGKNTLDARVEPDARETAESVAAGDRLAYTVTEAGSGSASSPSSPGGLFEAGEMFGRYQIKELVGQGGMGMVYAAVDLDLQRTVALKLLCCYTDAEGAITQARRRRLLREARAMARLEHPNVLTVYEVGTAGDRDFIAMAFVDSGSLERWLASETRPWREVVRVFLAAARGLEAAHGAGLVHRDFKPANVLMGKDGRVMVTDFGLARMDTDDERSLAGERVGATSALELTRTGALLGTPAYMAPEQHEGHTADARSDQYSLCVALYEGLIGTRPFTGSTLTALLEAKRARQVTEPRPNVEVVEVAEVPKALRDAVLRGLSPDPSERYASMGELIDALERAVAEPAATHEHGRRYRSGWRRVGGRALFWLVVPALVSLLMLYGGTDEPSRRPEPGMSEVPRAALVPEDPATRAQVEALRARLAEIEALDHQGRFFQALAECDPIVADARALGFAPLLAEALSRRAYVNRYLAKESEVRADWQEAALLAQESAYDRLYAEVTLRLAEVELDYSSDLGQQRATIRQAAVAVARLGDAPLEAATVQLLMARLSFEQDAFKGSETLAREALAVFQRAGDRLGTADAYRVLSWVQGRQGDREGALASARASWRVLTEEYGERDARLAPAIALVLTWYQGLGRHDEARQVFRETSWLWQEPAMRRLFEARWNPREGETRSVRGRVTQGGNHQPVVGAEVVLARSLISDGKYLLSARSAELMIRRSIYTQTTDADGFFRFDDVPASARMVAAESDTGRSPLLLLDERGESSSIELELQPFGRLEGTLSGVPAEDVHQVSIMLMPWGASESDDAAQYLEVPIQAGGRFEFERLAPGPYRLGVSTDRGSETVTIRHQQRVDVPPEGLLDLAIGGADERPGVAITVAVHGAKNVLVPAAIVLVLDAGVQSAPLREIRVALHASHDIWQDQTKMAKRGGRQIETTLVDVTPGPHSLCVLPLPGDLRSPDLERELGPYEEGLLIECRPITVLEQPEKQQVVFELAPPRASEPSNRP